MAFFSRWNQLDLVPLNNSVPPTNVTRMISFTRLPHFSRATLKSWEEPGYEAKARVTAIVLLLCNYHSISLGQILFYYQLITHFFNPCMIGAATVLLFVLPCLRDCTLYLSPLEPEHVFMG